MLCCARPATSQEVSWKITDGVSVCVVKPPWWLGGKGIGLKCRETQKSIPTSNHASNLKISALVDTLPDTWHYRVSTRTGWPSTSIL